MNHNQYIESLIDAERREREFERAVLDAGIPQDTQYAWETGKHTRVIEAMQARRMVPRRATHRDLVPEATREHYARLWQAEDKALLAAAEQAAEQASRQRPGLLRRLLGAIFRRGNQVRPVSE